MTKPRSGQQPPRGGDPRRGGGGRAAGGRDDGARADGRAGRPGGARADDGAGGGGRRSSDQRRPDRADGGGGRPDRRGRGDDDRRHGDDQRSAARDDRHSDGRRGADSRRGADDGSRRSRPLQVAAAHTPGREATGAPDAEMRIAKAMARAGLCSRREAERWVEDGRVSVNGEVLRTPARDVGPKDKVLVDGRPLPGAEPTQLWRYYKPRGLVTTHNDPQGRETVFDALPPDLPRVVSVGRLDFNTEGLLLLTNDGALARHLELPATGWLRRYRVRAHGRVTQAELDKLKDGVEVDGVRYGSVDATLDSVQGANVWLTIAIREGKNREVRKILTKFALDVNRLIRVSYGPFQLLELKPGEVEPVRRRTLADQLGAKLAAELHLVDTAENRKARWSGGAQSAGGKAGGNTGGSPGRTSGGTAGGKRGKPSGRDGA